MMQVPVYLGDVPAECFPLTVAIVNPVTGEPYWADTAESPDVVLSIPTRKTMGLDFVHVLFAFMPANGPVQLRVVLPREPV